MSGKLNKLLEYHNVCYHTVSRVKEIISFYVFSFRITCNVYIGWVCESSTMTQIYRSEDIVLIRIEKKPDIT